MASSDFFGTAVETKTEGSRVKARVGATSNGLMQDEVQRHWGAKGTAPVNESLEPGYAAKVMSTPSSIEEPSAGVMSAELKAHSSYSMSDLLYREEQVLSGASETLTGAKERAKEAARDWPLTGFEVVSGIGIGAVLVLASRNPALAVPIKVLNRTMMSVAAADLVGKVAIPSVDALAHPENTEADKHAVGRNLGSAVFDYSMAIAAGSLGTRAMTPLIERTKIGSMIQGYDYFKTPAGAELRIFKSGDALVSKNGIRTYKAAAGPDLDALTQPGGAGIVGNNDLLRQTFNERPQNAHAWREGKEVNESAGKWGTWFETVAGALANEITERTVDVGFGLIEHEYLVKQLESGKSAPSDQKPEDEKK